MTPSVDLYWLPLGAGGHFVAFNGRVYEALVARREHRGPLDIYHTALIVTVPEGPFVIENAWPIPDRDGATRGAMVVGPVGLPALGRLRAFRYEVRCWRDGKIADIHEAVASPQQVGDDDATTAFSSSFPTSQFSRGAASLPGRSRCGTRTPSSRGCSLPAEWT